MNDLTLICEGCRRPIEGDTGCLRVTFAAIGKARREQAEWDASHAGQALSIAELLLSPDDVHWRAYHYRCDPESGLDAYQIDAGRLRTWQHLAHWTAHLMEKNWLAFTDWDELLREVAGESRTRRPRIIVNLKSVA